MIPQIIYMTLSIFNLGYYFARHEQKIEKRFNFWTQLFCTLLESLLLLWGGFFDTLFN